MSRQEEEGGVPRGWGGGERDKTHRGQVGGDSFHRGHLGGGMTNPTGDTWEVTVPYRGHMGGDSTHR